MTSIRLSLLTVLIVLASIRAALPLTMTVVLGRSMEPTLRPGNFYVLDRGYYRSHTLSRGDIVVLRHNGETYIKRVSALPGDRLWLLWYDDGGGNQLLEPLEAARLRRLHAAGLLPGRSVLSVTIAPGHCFVMGDNAIVSVDSRDFGPVPVSAILGRAMP